MTLSSAWYRWEGGDLILEVLIQARASRDELLGSSGERLRVRIAAPPVEGEANARLCKLLADTFQVSKSMVTLVSGKTSRYKRVRIHAPRCLPAGIGLPAEDVVA